LHADASAAIGVVQRQGAGKIRHIDVGVLWIQQKELQKAVEILKLKSENNQADLMTKHVDRGKLEKHLQKLELEYREGRAESATRIHGSE
jgi:hypothetical protein